MKKAIILFIKFPREGEVKTRLAKDIGQKRATHFYQKCVEKIIHEIRELKRTHPIELFVYVSNSKDLSLCRNWLGEDFSYFSQRGEGLGQRLINASNDVFKIGYESLLIAGSDIPELSVKIFKKAFENLKNADFTIGPSPDGGYYLIGMKKPEPDVFNNISWSTDKVFGQTIDKIQSLQKVYTTLPSLRDIDTFEDFKAWRNSLSASTSLKRSQMLFLTRPL